MKRLQRFLIAVALSISMSSIAHASITTTTTFAPGPIPNPQFTNGEPTPGAYNLFNLDHNSYYTWGIDLRNIMSGVSITAATITFNNIQNWDTSSYSLWVELLDSATLGVKTLPDGSGLSNAFGNDSISQILLKNYTLGIPDPYHNPKTISYTIDAINNAAQLATLNKFAIDDGIIGLGFDPDCHFWNTGVSFSITTGPSGGNEAVPEPATMLLFGTGLAGLAGLRMRRKKN